MNPSEIKPNNQGIYRSRSNIIIIILISTFIQRINQLEIFIPLLVAVCERRNLKIDFHYPKYQAD